MTGNGSIYVDLDDVLGQTAKAFLGVLQREFEKSVDFEAIESFDLGKSLGLSEDALKVFMKSVHRPEVLSAIEPMQGAAKALGAWVDRGYEVSVVTGRPTATEAVSRRWLGASGLPHHNLTFLDKYSWSEEFLSETPALSLEELTRRPFRLAVEDSGEVALRLADTLAAPVVLMDRPWNRAAAVAAAEAAGKIYRCRDWQEIQERFPNP